MTRGKLLLAGIAALAISSALVRAQLPAGPPPGAPPGGNPAAPISSKDPKAAPAGNYAIDLHHSSVGARVLHRGLSYNVLRFGVTKATMKWDAANPQAIALDVTVDAKPYYAPIVYRFAPESDRFLNVAKFPEIRFVSTAVRPTGGNKADVEGRLTMMGVTKPAVIHAELVGVGPSPEDSAPTIGFTGSMMVNWTDFSAGMGPGQVSLTLDAEFNKTS